MEHTEQQESARIIALWQTAREIANGAEPYEPSAVILRDEGERNGISCARVWEVCETRSIAYIVGEEGRYTVADGCLLAEQREVKVLVADVNEVRGNILEGSSVWGLYLGAHVEKITDDILESHMRYLCAAEENPHFKSEEDVLFSHDGTQLYRYASHKPEEVYRVPPTVKVISNMAFCGAAALRRLYVPRGVTCLGGAPLAWATVSGETEIIFY